MRIKLPNRSRTTDTEQLRTAAMAAYLLKRLLLIIPTMFGIMLISFIIIQFAPGGPVERMIAQRHRHGRVGDGAHRRQPGRTLRSDRRRSRRKGAGDGGSSSIAARRASTRSSSRASKSSSASTSRRTSASF